MSDVFISYSRKNSPFARRLIDQLTHANKDAWVDWEGIPLTSPNWWAEIKAGIEGADSFVFIISPDAMASVVCNMELDYAIELKKRIIPVVYAEVVSRDAFASIADFEPDKAMEERLAGKDPLKIARDNWQRLSHINWVFFRVSDDFDESFQRMLIAVETDLPYVKAHTRYLTRALEWEREQQRADLLLFGAEIDVAEQWFIQAKAYDKPRDEKAKEAIVNPALKPIQQAYIVASRRAQQRRRMVAGSGVLIATAALVFAVVALLGGVQATNSANEAATREAAANNQLAVVNDQLTTAVPATLTQVSEQVIVAQAQAQDANNQQATATRQVATAVVAQAQAQAQAQDANNQQSTATRQVATAVALQAELAVEAVIASSFLSIRANRAINNEQMINGANQIVNRFPNFSLSFTARGIMLFEIGEYEKALNDHNRVLQLNPNDIGGYINRARALDGLGRFEEAIADFTYALSLPLPEIDQFLTFNSHAMAYVNRGLSYSQLKMFEQAVDDYSNAILIQPDYYEAWNNRGSAKHNLGDSEGALDDMTQAIELEGGFSIAYYSRGIVYEDLTEFESAILDFTRALELGSPNDCLFCIHLRRGSAYASLGETERAIADYDRAIDLDPNDAFAFYRRGTAYARLGDNTRAIADYDRAIDLDPNLAAAFTNRGNTYSRLGDNTRAIADYDRAIELDPNLAAAFTNRGIAYSRLGDNTRAIADFDRAIELDPNDAIAVNGRGTAYARLGDNTRAIADFDRAIELDPSYAFAFYNRGNAYNDLGEFERAIADYDRVIDFSSDDTMEINNQLTSLCVECAHNERGLILHDKFGRLEEAIDAYDQAIEVDSEFSLAYYNRGRAYTDLSLQSIDPGTSIARVLKALEDYTRAIDLDEEYQAAYINRSIIFLGLQRYQDAISDLDIAITLDSEFLPIGYTNRGLAYYLKADSSNTRRADLEQSLADWREAQRLGQSLPQAILDDIAEIEAELSGQAIATPTPPPASQGDPSLIEQGEVSPGENRATLAVNTIHLWTYAGQAGETLILTTVANWDTILFLLDSDLNVLVENDDEEGLPNNNSRITFILPNQGTYFIAMAGYQNEFGGDYMLRVNE